MSTTTTAPAGAPQLETTLEPLVIADEAGYHARRAGQIHQQRRALASSPMDGRPGL
ncbi:MAG: hypothetical protein Q4P32_00725 [Micrococcales bacterium]|nr:hypothetical protein [Micrococcales bacterium]